VPVTLQSREKHRQERLEPLPADPVRRLPEDDECLPDCLVVNATTRPPGRDPRARKGAQDANRVLPVIPRESNELVQDGGASRPSTPLGTGRRPPEPTPALPPR
jgi:hypothetical protein